MESRCIEVNTRDGEKARKLLAEKDLLDTNLKIKKEDGYLYIPIKNKKDGLDSLSGIEYKIDKKTFEVRSNPTSPKEILGRKPSYEIIGSIALLEKKETKEAGEAILNADNNIKSVFRITSPVEGERRVRDLEYICGEKTTKTIYREYGREFLVDISEVYFSPRLANERRRIIEKISKNEKVFDMFAGVGPYTVGAAQKKAKVISVDKNPEAYKYLEKNIKRNNVENRVKTYNSDVKKIAKKINGVDRIIMDYPQGAKEFLNSAFDTIQETGIIHFYDMSPEQEFEKSKNKIIKKSKKQGFNIKEINIKKVRSYAPGIYNICIDTKIQR